MKFRLEELCNITSSKRIYREEYVNYGIPFYRGKEIIEKANGQSVSNELFITEEKYNEILNKYGVPTKGDIIITAVGTIGISYLVGDETFYFKDGNLIWLKEFNNKINNEFLSIYLKTQKFKNDIEQISIGSTQKAITIVELKRLKIDVPPIEIQNKIVKIYNSIDKKIELNNQINDNLLKVCNMLFHSFLNENKDMITNKKIVEIVNKVVTGKTPSTKNEEFWKEEIPFITIPDMHNQVFTIDTERKISKLGAKAIIPKNSISVSCIATVGLASINIEESQTNQQINSIIINNEYDLYYIYEYLSEQEDFLKNIAGGSTTYNINKSMFENIEIPYLPEDKMKELHHKVSKMFDKIKENQLENRNLEQLRNILLPKLMNGEIDLEKVKM